MTTRPTYIGRREYNVTDVSAEYRTLAESDEKVGQLLIGQGQCHAPRKLGSREC